MSGFLFSFLLLFTFTVSLSQSVRYVVDHGAITRTDTTRHAISLVFTAHEYAEGYATIDSVLDRHGIKASFFFTGDFYRNPVFQKVILDLQAKGHYLGGHSDKHLLYCSWENRDSLLVSKDSFLLDLKNNYREMKRLGIRKQEAPYFMPPYEWYNDSISLWSKECGLTLVNFTSGTYSNADWTYPELGGQYLDSRSIFERIIAYDNAHGLNGFLLLLHLGTDPRREDKFYTQLDELITVLEQKGYLFTTLWESMPP